LQDTVSKKLITKRAGGVAQDIGPELKPQYCKKKKKKTKNTQRNPKTHHYQEQQKKKPSR
jgi:hypothetical protein